MYLQNPAEIRIARACSNREQASHVWLYVLVVTMGQLTPPTAMVGYGRKLILTPKLLPRIVMAMLPCTSALGGVMLVMVGAL